MVNWHRFIPADFEYDFERDELAAHHVTFEETLDSVFNTLCSFLIHSYRTRHFLSFIRPSSFT